MLVRRDYTKTRRLPLLYSVSSRVSALPSESTTIITLVCYKMTRLFFARRPRDIKGTHSSYKDCSHMAAARGIYDMPLWVFWRTLEGVMLPVHEIPKRNAGCNIMALVGSRWHIVFAPLTRACSPGSTRCVVIQGTPGLQITQIARPWWRWVKIGCNRATNATMVDLAAACPNITHLDLSGCYDIRDPGLASIALACPAITTLNLGDCGVGDDGLRSLAAGCPDIDTLDLSGCSFSGELLGIFGALTTLKLYGCAVGDAGMENLCNTLIVLNLMDCEAITNTGLGSLVDRCPNLTSLCLAGCVQVTNAGLERLAGGCRALSHVDLRGCPQVGKTGLEHLAALPNMCSVRFTANAAISQLPPAIFSASQPFQDDY